MRCNLSSKAPSVALSSGQNPHGSICFIFPFIVATTICLHLIFQHEHPYIQYYFVNVHANSHYKHKLWVQQYEFYSIHWIWFVECVCVFDYFVWATDGGNKNKRRRQRIRRAKKLKASTSMRSTRIINLSHMQCKSNKRLNLSMHEQTIHHSSVRKIHALVVMLLLRLCIHHMKWNWTK